MSTATDYDEQYQVRYIDKDTKQEVNDLRTGDEALAVSRRDSLRQAGQKNVHIQYSMKNGGPVLGEAKVISPKVGFRPEFLKTPIIYGKEITLKMPNGENRKGQFAIVELDDIIASHDEQTFSSSLGYPMDSKGENVNDRNYHEDINSQGKVVEFAQNLDPDRLVVTSRTPAGTPIITNDGIVVSGNNRTMSLKLAVKNYPEKYKEYLSFLNDEIEAFGFRNTDRAALFGEKISDERVRRETFSDTEYIKFIHPVLVRFDYDFPQYDTLELSKYNKETKKSERPIDKAIKLGKMLSGSEKCMSVISEIVGRYETFSEMYSNYSDQKAIMDSLVNCNILTSQEIPAYFHERGFTEQGKELIENLLVGIVLSKDAVIAANEGGARSFRQTIITSLPVLTANLALADDSLNAELNAAVLMQAKLIPGKVSFEDLITQTNIFNETYSENTMFMNRLLASGRNKFKSAIESYNDSVRENQGPSLFGEKPTKQEIFDTHIKNKIDPDERKAIEKAVKNTAESLKEHLSDTSAEGITVKYDDGKTTFKFPNGDIVEPGNPTVTIENPFISGRFFRANPDKILGDQVAGIDRWKKNIVEIKGTIENLSRIQVNDNFVTNTEAAQPTVTAIEQSVFVASESDSGTVDNLLNAIKQNQVDEPKKRERKEKKKKAELAPSENTETDTYSIREVYTMLNPEITLDELRAFVWYQHHRGRPITNPEWLELCEMEASDIYNNPDLLNAWVKQGILYYFDGQLLPAYLYLAENVYDKKVRLISAKDIEKGKQAASGHDAQYIIDTYGKEVFDNQVKALSEVYQQKYSERLIIKGEGADDGLMILPISKFAKEYKIKTLVDGNTFRWKKISAASDKRFGKPDFLETYVADKDKKEFDELSLTDAFCYWLRTDETIQYHKGMNYADIIKIYIQARSKPATSAIANADGHYVGEQLTIKKKEDAAWERLKSKAKDEGDRLFIKFIADQLTLNDKVTIETQWNREYNGYVSINYNKVPVAFRCNRFDMGKPMEIKPEKREAVAFTVSEGSGLLAYDVGVGKTPSAIFTICQFLDMGWAKRPFLSVPNQTYKQWISEWSKFAGHVRINEFYNLDESYIQDWQDVNGKTKMVPVGSVSIITNEGMKRIGLNETTTAEMTPGLAAILMQESPDDEKMTDKKRDREAEKLNSAVEKIIGKALAKTIINIEDLGFDFFSLDEAHSAKKVFTFIKGESEENLGNSGKSTRSVVRYEIKSGEPSFMGIKSFIICQYIQNLSKGNVIYLTATPFSNSPLEVYSMMAMVAFNKLKEMGLNNLSTFFDNFVAVSYAMVINSRLKPERRQIIEGWNNLISLQTLIRRFINYKTGEQVKVPRPNKYVLPMRNKLVNGLMVSLPEDEIIDTALPLTAIQARLMTKIKEYADGQISEGQMCTQSLEEEDEDVDGAKSEGVEIDEDAMDADEKVGVRLLKAMNHARNLALSPFIFECSGLGAPNYKSYIETSNKLLYTMLCIKSVKDYHAKNNSEMSGIVIYMDRGVQYFPLIKEYIVKELGFMDHEVGIISSKLMQPIEKGIQKEDQKEYVKNLFLGKKFNHATLEMEEIPSEQRIKVLIGSSTIKEGINLQAHSSTLFNCWQMWNPTENQQLEGRIWRQGNIFNNVRIVHPLMIDSMDIFMFQKLEEKTSRINTIWQSDGRTNVLKTEEFNPKELKYSLIKDPVILAQMEIMETAEKIEEDISDLENQIKRNNKIIEYKATILSHTKGLEEWLEEYRPSNGKKRNAEQLVGLSQEVLKKQTDSQGKKMEVDWRKDKKKPAGYYSELSEATKQYWFDDFVYAVRNMKREERDYLSPRGVTVKDLPEYTLKLKDRIEKLNEEKKLVSSDEAINIKAKEIHEYRLANMIEPKTVPQMVSEFSRLNYLLSDIKFPVKKLEFVETCPPVDKKGNVRVDAEGIRLLDECIRHNPDTKLMHTVQVSDDEGNSHLEYKPERKKLHAKIINEIVGNSICIERGQPIAILTGGAPGSGKSTFLNKYAPYLQSNRIYKIDADEIREKLPEYKGWNSSSTHQETRDIVNDLLTSFDKPCKHDLLYDGTMSNGKKYIPLIKKLKAMGYKVFIAYMEVPKQVSLDRAMSRFKSNKGGKTQYGRYVPKSVIDDFFNTGTAGYEEIKSAVDGYILVDGLSQKIIESGGEQIPHDRDYQVMFNEKSEKELALPSKNEYEDSLQAAEIMMEVAESKKEKKAYREYIDALKIMIETL